jgi:hypothetical protein
VPRVVNVEHQIIPHNTAEDHERRGHTRIPVEGACMLQFAGQDAPVSCSILDVSQDGCRVGVQKRLALRCGWPVEISFEVSGISFRLNGMLQWVAAGSVMGIRFVNVIPRRMLDLAEMLSELETAAVLAAGANKVAAVPAPQQPAAKLDVAAADAPAGAKKPPQIERPATAEIPPHERRGTLRHDVDNYASIYLVNVGSKLCGRIIDLSLTGCRIQTDVRFPVGIYTRVEAEFHLEGLPFRLGGVIQAIHDRHTVGIRFLDLSERKRQQVIDLIDEITEIHVEVMACRTPAQNS